MTVREVGVAEIWDATSGRRVAEIRPDSSLQDMGTAPVDGAFHVFIESIVDDEVRLVNEHGQLFRQRPVR